jgi:hypothetical protein
MRRPSPAGNVHSIGFPHKDALNKGGIPKPEGVMCTRVPCCIRNELEIVTFDEWNIPGNLTPKASIWCSCRCCVPGEKDLDFNIVPLR